MSKHFPEELAFFRLKKRHPNIVKNGFAKSIEKIIGAGELKADEFHITRIPDASEADLDKKMVRCFEIEDTCNLSNERLSYYSLLGMELYDYYGIHLEVVITCKEGKKEVVTYTSKDDVCWEVKGFEGISFSVTQIEALEAKGLI